MRIKEMLVLREGMTKQITLGQLGREKRITVIIRRILVGLGGGSFSFTFSFSIISFFSDGNNDHLEDGSDFSHCFFGGEVNDIFFLINSFNVPLININLNE